MLHAASRLMLVVGSVAVGAAGAIALRADVLVGYGVSKALEGRVTTAVFEASPATAAPARTAKAEVGDEAYWLDRAGSVATPVALGKRLAVGDRVAITGSDGHARRLEVVDLKPVGTPVLQVADTTAAVRLVQVTCRIVGTSVSTGHDAKDELVRFFIEAEDLKPAALPAVDGHAGRT